MARWGESDAIARQISDRCAGAAPREFAPQLLTFGEAFAPEVERAPAPGRGRAMGALREPAIHILNGSKRPIDHATLRGSCKIWRKARATPLKDALLITQIVPAAAPERQGNQRQHQHAAWLAGPAGTRVAVSSLSLESWRATGRERVC